MDGWGMYFFFKCSFYSDPIYLLTFWKLLFQDETTTSPPLHTYTLERKETKNSFLQCKENDQMLKNSDVKNVNKSKNRLTPVKLESKKQDKKVLASREGSLLYFVIKKLYFQQLIKNKFAFYMTFQTFQNACYFVNFKYFHTFKFL